MPLQTRSRAAAASTPDTKGEVASDEASTHREGGSSSSSDAKSPAHESVGPLPPREPAITTGSEEPRYESPAARERDPRISSAQRRRPPPSPSEIHSRSWQDRARSYRSSGGGPQEHNMFSPPPYKTAQFSQPQREPPQTSTMDLGERRDFDQLDLNEDLSGPGDPLLLGGFPDESPPRAGGLSPTAEMEPSSERKRPASLSHPARRSPQPQPYYHHPSYPPSSTYRRSPAPRSGGYHQTPSSHSRPPPSMYHYGSYPPHGSPPPGYGGPTTSSPRPGYYPGYSPYYHYHQEQQWEGHYHHPPPFEHEDDIPPPPPSSTKKRPNADEPLSPRADDDTPTEDLKPRSPFRSPPQSMTKQKFRRSPFFHPSPHIGAYGSFGMDTPSAVLAPAEFSPMGPSFTEFGDESAPLPFPGDIGDKLSISRSGSHDSDTPAMIRRRPAKDEPSPLSGFMSGLSPFDTAMHGVARSPLHHTAAVYEEPASRDRAPPKAAVTVSGSVADARPPLGTPHGSVHKPRNLWPESGPGSAGHMRVEIGGAGSLSTRKTLEGINSMMHPRHPPREATPSSSRSSYPSGPPPPHHHAPPPPHHPPRPGIYRSDMATPIKTGGHPYARPTSSSGHHHPYAQGSASKLGYPTSAQKSSYPGTAQRPNFPIEPSSADRSRPINPAAGKENKKKSLPKRSPCNCKKSKCLKLYCECFAAERFCQGCNCADCGNTPTSGLIRDKAIKDTRAKNPNAFKPRISAKQLVAQGNAPHDGHNMGCRCKRSECLKKYCECFQAGVICGGKCKCSDCLNYAGSQALIDKRRKIKDQRGADFAMRVADEAWKQGRGSGSRKPAPPASRRPPMPSPAGGRMPPPHMMHPSPRGPPPLGGPPPPHYMGHPMMMGPPMGYSPMGMPMTPAGYPNAPPHMTQGEPPRGMYPPPPGPPPTSSRHVKTPRGPSNVTPIVAAPKTPGVRVKFDPASSRKKRQPSPGKPEPTLPYFGQKYPEQPKTTALAIFSFLSNDDLYNAGLVCKSWSQLAMDGELWKFQT